SAISLAVGTTSLRVRAGTITHDKNGQFVKVREIKRPGDGTTSITTETYLQEGELNISANSVCDEFIVGKTKPETQLCAGGFYVTGGTATCKYDMGGPLMQKRGDTWYLFGLSSTANYAVSNCKQETVFTRVEGFCDWFSTTTGIACLN
ncbi:hypothetical protein PRIPAC_95356, partial [Pristionchus pacificus]|uniref:Trypsin n=1 Tax=Pristionchus pacificus TaxID=54126 RepID=A0A2A6D1Q5_PRIPA